MTSTKDGIMSTPNSQHTRIHCRFVGNCNRKVVLVVSSFLLVFYSITTTHLSNLLEEFVDLSSHDDSSAAGATITANSQLRKLRPKRSSNQPKKMSPECTCFVTASYGEVRKNLDRHFNSAAKLKDDENIHDVLFFFFTNLKDLDVPGWHVIVTDLDYNRFITHSRWAKFMAWKHPTVADRCHTIYYMDSIVRPTKPLRYYIDFASDIRQSASGIAQVKSTYNPKGILNEFQLILRKKKDIKENVSASISWLNQQSDFVDGPTAPIYANTFFGYDPRSEKFRDVAEFFWGRYSLEIDSWRDQPLWAYTMHHFHMEPLTLDTSWFYIDFDSRGHKGHSYSKASNSDAVKFILGG